MAMAKLRLAIHGSKVRQGDGGCCRLRVSAGDGEVVVLLRTVGVDVGWMEARGIGGGVAAILGCERHDVGSSRL